MENKTSHQFKRASLNYARLINASFIFNYSKLLTSLVAVAALCEFLYMLPVIGSVPKLTMFTHQALVLILAVLVFQSVAKRGVELWKTLFFLWLVAVFITLYGISPIRLIECVGIVAFVFLSEANQQTAFEKFKSIFAAILLVNIVAYPFAALELLPNFGVIVPDHWLKQATGMYYDNFGITFVIHEDEALNLSVSSVLYRMSAWFEEPGNVGTISALLLAATQFKMDRRGKIILLGGLLSFSLAFYAMIIFYQVIKKPKSLIYLLLAGAVFLFVFQDNEFVSTRIIDRVFVSDSSVSADNRTEELFDVAFDEYIQTPSVWLGHDKDHQLYNLQYNAYSWKNLVWDYGVIGTAFYISVFFFLIAIKNVFNLKQALSIQSNRALPFILIFFISIYQRPYVLSLLYVLIFVAGINVGLKDKAHDNR